MNQHKLTVFCGQIKFLHEFFEGYQDENVQVTIDKVNKIDMQLTAETDLSGEETERHLKQAFKQSSLGTALYFTIKLQEK